MKESLKKRLSELIRDLIRKNVLHDRRLIRAFEEVPMDKFIPQRLFDKNKIYLDMPQLFYFKDPLNRRTISAPHMICIMLESLNLHSTDNLLVLGSKSGYISALCSRLSPAGEIFILEAIKEIRGSTETTLKELGFGRNITIIGPTNPLYGLKEQAPWQKILVTGQVEKGDLEFILYQLDENGGVLFAPIGNMFQQKFTQIIREGDDFYFNEIGDVVFGPLDVEPTYDIIAEEAELPEMTPAKFHPIAFKIDLGEMDKKMREALEHYIIEGQKEGDATDEEIIETAIDLAEKHKGVIHLVTVADYLNVKEERVERALRNVPAGSIQTYKSELISDKIFVLNKEKFQENLKELLKTLKTVHKIVVSIKNVHSVSDLLSYLNTIDEEFSKIKETSHDIKIKKIKHILTEIRSICLTMKKVEERVGTDPNLISKIEQLTMEQLEKVEVLHDILHERISNLESFLT